MDPVADMLTIIHNGYMAKKGHVLMPYSKFKLAIAKVMATEKFIGRVETTNSDKSDGFKKIQIELIYENQKPKMTQVKRISKSGLRIYIKSKNIKKVKGGRGTVIVSTPQGVMAGAQAKSKKLGGEIICEVW